MGRHPFDKPRPQPIEESPLNRLRERPYLAGDATEKTWSFCWTELTTEQAAYQAARLAEFFAAEVIRLEASE